MLCVPEYFYEFAHLLQFRDEVADRSQKAEARKNKSIPLPFDCDQLLYFGIEEDAQIHENVQVRIALLLEA